MIRNIVFDIGQVLVDFNWESYTEGLGFDEDVTDRLKKATVANVVWKEQDRGSYSLEELIELHAAGDPEITDEIRIFFEKIEGIVSERAYAVKLVRYLKEQGYKVYILSNYGKYTFEFAEKNFQFLKYTDGGIISYQVHSVKPEEKIYKCLIEKYKIVPAETVFIDDLEENIEEGIKQGFQGIHFKAIEQVLGNLSMLGVDMEDLHL